MAHNVFHRIAEAVNLNEATVERYFLSGLLWLVGWVDPRAGGQVWRLWRLADEPFGVRPVCAGEHGCWDAASARPPGTNVGGAFGLLAEMVATATSGSVVTMICNSGERYGTPCWIPGRAAGLRAVLPLAGAGRRQRRMSIWLPLARVR